MEGLTDQHLLHFTTFSVLNVKMILFPDIVPDDNVHNLSHFLIKSKILFFWKDKTCPGVLFQSFRFLQGCLKRQCFCFSIAVKHLRIEKTASQNASQFELVTEKGKGNVHLQYLFAHLD